MRNGYAGIPDSILIGPSSQSVYKRVRWLNLFNVLLKSHWRKYQLMRKKIMSISMVQATALQVTDSDNTNIGSLVILRNTKEKDLDQMKSDFIG